MIIRKEKEIGGRTLSIETGRLAKQASGSALMRYGDTMVLVTATASKEAREDIDFFPLSVEFQEKTYSAGKIPGGFFKREGRPTEKEILSARLIDRPLRPLFPEGYQNDTQIAAFVISSDQENNGDILGAIGASVALSISDIPFGGPIASVRVGRINGQFVINPTYSQLEESDIDLIIAGTSDSILMVEGESREISESDMIQALSFGHPYIQQIIELENEIISEFTIEKMPLTESELPADLVEKTDNYARSKIQEAIQIADKKSRHNRLDEIRQEVFDNLTEEGNEENIKIFKNILYQIEKEEVRSMIIKEQKRLDGRGLDDIRDIGCEIGILPRAHGSALFTRGQTQSLGVTTLGTKMDEQIVDALEGESKKSYMLHYNFPPFSVGEVRPFRGPGRREIGHGNLAERSLKPVLPSEDDFPYTIRIVSDILESNGSSSMATVCSGSLSLMDAGIPVKTHVAGIAMGLIKEDEEIRILTDILGDEDHLGDMDFKVAGTREGITAFQMDIKISGLSFDIMEEALQKAKIARMKILDLMEKAIEKPKADLSPYAPRILTLTIPSDRIGEVIGPSGKIIRGIIEETGVKIDIDDDGFTVIASPDVEMALLAKSKIEMIIQDPEVGKEYEATIKRIMNFGAFAEFLPGKEGLIHISELDNHRVKTVNDVVKIGDKVHVILKEIDREGRFNLSRKEYLRRQQENGEIKE
ncbi:MAG: polyribonucleotide nucleotidyltransferase [Calditrichaeota bacterium]|nr:polyribonucleotide nucleotidyltransferase [Calditrichota bacterium]RQV92591.1 MAG: polyribonucleotide nucleotidyltransferase [bacterium]RQW07589.1 MAG: polyribonucleotide nucleotidyltransferase [Calditrichota bacterium]